MLRRWIRRAVVATLLALVPTLPASWSAAAGAAEPVREWTDESGRFGLNAAFVRRNDFGVVLRDDAGGERHLLWDQISRRDQEYVAGVVAADPKLRVSCPQAKSYISVVSEGKEGAKSYYDGAVGFVFQTVGDRSLVTLTQNIDERLLSERVKSDQIRYRAMIADSNPPRELVLEKSPMRFGKDGILLFGSKSKLPQPISSENRLNAKAGDVLYLVQYQIDRHAKPVSPQRKVLPVVVRYVFLTAEGTPAGFRVESPIDIVANDAIVVADDGSTIALVEEMGRRSSMMMRHTFEEPRGSRFFDCIGLHSRWSEYSTLPGGQIGGRAEKTPTGWKIEPLASFGEVFRKAAEVKMMIEPVVAEGSDEKQFVVENGRWKNASPRGQILDLKKIANFDPALAMDSHPTPQPDHSYWSAVTTIDLPAKDPQKITCAFIVVDESGTFRRVRFGLTWRLDDKKSTWPFDPDRLRVAGQPELPTLKPKIDLSN